MFLGVFRSGASHWIYVKIEVRFPVSHPFILPGQVDLPDEC